MDLDKNITVKQSRGQIKKGIHRLMVVKPHLSLEEAFQLQFESFLACKYPWDISHEKELEFILEELYKEMQETFKEEERLRDPKVQARRLAKRLNRLSQKKTT